MSSYGDVSISIDESSDSATTTKSVSVKDFDAADKKSYGFQDCSEPVTVRFTNVNYTVHEEAGPKKILKNVSGAIHPGEMLAILGPSGAGKTTLLSSLLGRATIDSEHVLEGSITAGKRPISEFNKRKIGYVMQEEYLFSELTVRESLQFAALLRLPRTMTRAEKLERVEELLAALGLEKCADTKIGNQFKRGVSGGEKKRVNIATEMLFLPSILMLDEPTSGLDSSTALDVIQELRALASTNRTVVTTIHQPSSQIFANFDKVCLMRQGEIIYFGPAKEVVSYFTRIGIEPPPHYNPADFMLEVASEAQEVDLRAAWEAEMEMDSETSEEVTETFEELSKGCCAGKWEAPYWQQLYLLTDRSFKQTRGEKFSWISTCQFTAMTIIMSILWFQIDRTDVTLRDRLGALFFPATFWTFSPLFDVLTVFPAERSVLKRERASGMYRISAYFLAKSLAEIPLQLVYPLLSMTVVYWASGMTADAGKFVVYMCVLMMQVLSAQSVGLIFGAAVMDLKKAIAIMSTMILAMMLIGGFYVNNSNLPDFLRYVQYASLIKYPYEALVLNEIRGETYQCVNPDDTAFAYCPVDEAAIRDQYDLRGTVGEKVAVMFGFIVVFRIVAYLFLRFNKKTK